MSQDTAPARRRRAARNATVEPAEDVQEYVVPRPPGLVGRFLATYRQLTGLLAGGLVAHARARRETLAGRRAGPGLLAERALASLVRVFLDRDLRDQPFAVQLRRRLERLGPTYVKLGQILSLREDLLPKSITDELKLLLSRLPAVPFPVLAETIARDTGRALDDMYAWVDPHPLGSASIGQVHRATTVAGDAVIIKVVKPGIRDTLERDARLLGGLAVLLQVVFPRYQPRKMLHEFTSYTLREVDLRLEADNAETFTANFRDMPDVVFPAIHREYSGRDVLCMEFLDGVAPDSPRAESLSLEDRRRLTDLGAESIIRMLYRDGFFHADLHPGNLMVLPGPKVGFIDLGMVGRLSDETRRTMMYYYYSLVTGDAEGAARYLSAVADPGPGGDAAGFRREVSDISRRWQRSATFEGYSLGQLILESVTRGAHYRMYFPVEMVLMVKALITFEGVGHLLLPGFDVADVSERHIRRVFLHQFSPLRVAQGGVRGAPDLLDAMVRVPALMTEGFRVLEKTVREPRPNPLIGVRGALIGGFCLLAGAVVIAAGGPWPIWALLFLAGVILAVRRG